MKKEAMKKILFLLLILGIYSCQDSEITEVTQKTITEKQSESDFLVFRTKGELQSSIQTLKRLKDSQVKDFATTRAAISVPIPDSFQSLLESNREKCLSKLTATQLDTIKKDPDQLEFCLSDSVIADYEFAQLLNANRMIQVEGIVYRYFPNCVAYTKARNAKALKNLPEQLKPAEKESELRISSDSDEIITIIRNKYKEEEATTETNHSKGDYDGDGLQLGNGVIIPLDNIRDVDYNSNGDGGWLHKMWNGIWGRNVLAIKKINGHKRLRLGFYDQHYIVYANIGAKLKMQKKVCGIWWNCKADEMRIGWSAIEMKTTFSKPFIKILKPELSMQPNIINNNDIYPPFIRSGFPFKNEDQVLLHLPLVSYDLKTKDINSFLQHGIQEALKKAKERVTDINNPSGKFGIYSADDNVFYAVCGSDEKSKQNTRTFEHKFYRQNFPGSIKIGISYGGGDIKVTELEINKGVNVKLGRGIVYGAIKYRGKWFAARITKEDVE